MWIYMYITLKVERGAVEVDLEECRSKSQRATVFERGRGKRSVIKEHYFV